MREIITDKVEIIKSIEKGKIENNYLLLGPDYFSKREIVSKLNEKVIDPAFESFDNLTFFADEKNAFLEISEAINIIPITSDKKLIKVYFSEKLIKNKNNEKLEIIKNSPKSSCIVFLSDLGDSRKVLKSKNTPWFIKEISKISTTAIFLDPYPNERRKIIIKLLKEYNLFLSDNSINRIVISGPTTINELHLLFQKLSNYKELSDEIITSLILINDDFENLSIAIGKRNYKKTIELYNNSILWGHKISEILSYISRFFLYLLELKPLNDYSNGFVISKKLLQKGIYIPADKALKYSKITINWEFDEILNIRKKIFKLILNIRKGNLNEKLALISFLTYICNYKSNSLTKR